MVAPDSISGMVRKVDNAAYHDCGTSVRLALKHAYEQFDEFIIGTKWGLALDGLSHSEEKRPLYVEFSTIPA